MPTKNRLDKLILFFICISSVGLVFSNALTEIGVGFSIFLWIIKKSKDRKLFIPRKFIILSCLYILSVSLSLINSEYFLNSYRGLLRNIKYIVFCWVVLETLSLRKNLRIFILVLLGGMSLALLDGLYQNFWGVDFIRGRMINPIESLRRVSASFVHPNDFGCYLVTLFSVVLSLFILFKKRNQKYILMIIGGVAIFLILKTFSRGAWLGWISSVFLFFTIWKRRYFPIYAISLVVILLIFSFLFKDRFLSLLDTHQGTVWERLQLWRGTFSMIKEHPFIGFGINTYSRVFPKYKPLDYPDIRYAHNSYLQMASEIGLVGLFSFLILIGYVFFKALYVFKNKSDVVGMGFLSGWVGFLIHAGVDTHLYSLCLSTLFWMFTGVILSMVKICEKNFQ